MRRSPCFCMECAYASLSPHILVVEQNREGDKQNVRDL